MSFGDMFGSIDSDINEIIASKTDEQLVEMLYYLRELIAKGTYTIDSEQGPVVVGDLVRAVRRDLDRRGVKA